MPYLEFRPAPQLAHIVKCFWTFDAEANVIAGRPERVVPDGNPELVIHYAHPFGGSLPGRGFAPQPRAFMLGQMTKPLLLDSSQGAAGLVGVRFHAFGSRLAVGAHMDELTDVTLRVEDFDPGASAPLVDAIACAPGMQARVAILQRYIAQLVARNERFQDQAVGHWAVQIANARGTLGLAALAHDSGISVRQLERRFLKQIGVAPRQYANVVRFRRVFDLVTASERPDWVRLALRAGYFDQPHMIRDFHRFLGCTPTQFISQLRGISAALIGLDEETGCRVVTRRELIH
jgi:AraC-like DNA-binding protein